jgi:hypothetical protein
VRRFDFELRGQHYHPTIGRFDDGTPAVVSMGGIGASFIGYQHPLNMTPPKVEDDAAEVRV